MVDERIKVDLRHLADAERLARVIFSPSMICGGEVAPSAFNLVRLPSGKYDPYVSVHRMDFQIPTRESCSHIKPRVSGDSMAGYAWMVAGNVRATHIRSITVSVAPMPSKNSLFHAGIFYSQDGALLKGKCESVEFLRLTAALAKQCKYVSF